MLSLVEIFSQTQSVPQNDHLNLSFVIDKHVVGNIWSKNGYLSVAIFWESANLHGPQATSEAIIFDQIKI